MGINFFKNVFCESAFLPKPTLFTIDGVQFIRQFFFF